MLVMLDQWYLLKHRWKKIILKIVELGGEVSFEQLRKEMNIAQSSLAYILNILRKKGILEAKARGRFKISYLTPLIFLNKEYITNGIAYFGLLGLKMERPKPEYKIAIDQLEKIGYKVRKKVIATALKAIQSWNEEVLNDVEWFLLKENQLFNPKDAETALKQKVLYLAKNYPLIIDVTSGPRTAALALFKISSEHCIPTIYIREDTKQIIWIKHPDEILKDILP